MAELDALNSLANFYFNNPENSFPIPADKDFVIDAKEMGHPMILEKQRVNNDIHFNDWKNFIIITGANMAGKKHVSSHPWGKHGFGQYGFVGMCTIF